MTDVKYLLIVITLLTVSWRYQETDDSSSIALAIIGNKQAVVNNESVPYEQRYSVDISELFKKSIEATLAQDFVVDNYLSKEEIDFLTSDAEVAALKVQKTKTVLWKDILTPSENLSIHNPENPKDSGAIAYALSAPLLSTDGQFAFVYTIISKDVDVAFGVIFFLKKENGTWKVLASFNQWNS